MKQSEQLNELASAMSKLQSEIRDAEKDVQGYGYKYANLGSVLGLIRPLLEKNGLSFQQHPSTHDDKVSVHIIILHSSGQWVSSELSMPLVPMKNMNAAQAVGNILSYARRYQISAVFGITQVDDDTSPKDEPHKPYAPIAHVAAVKPVAAKSAPKTEDPGIPWENGKSILITEKEVEQLGMWIFEAGADIEKLMDAYQVKRFEQLTRGQFEDAMKKLKKKIDDKAKK